MVFNLLYRVRDPRDRCIQNEIHREGMNADKKQRVLNCLRISARLGDRGIGIRLRSLATHPPTSDTVGNEG